MLRKLALTSLVLLALKGGYAQNKPINNTIPKIPEFYREYEPSVSNWLIDASGKIFWDSKRYKKGGDDILEMYGYCNLDVSFMLIGVEKIYVGFITRINHSKNTLETIVYNNGSKGKDLSPDDSLVAKQEHIDLSSTDEIYHEIIDYNSRTARNMETEKIDTLMNGGAGFQEAYFLVPKDKNSFINVRYKGETYLFQTRSRKDGDEKYIFIDLTMPDPENLGERKNIVDKISYLKVYYDDEYIPVKVLARVNTPIGETNVTAEYEP